MAPPPSTSRPGRTLLVLAGIIVAMVAGMFLTGATTPRLGLDLQGGTSVVLQPRVTGGGDVSDDALREAVNIIRQRVNGLGVTEADVQTQGDNIVVSVPGATSQEAVELIASTAQLNFRPVLEIGAPVPTQPEPTPTPSASASEKGKKGNKDGKGKQNGQGRRDRDSASPSPSPTSQGRALPSVLRAQTDEPTPEESAEPSPQPTELPTTPPVPPTPGINDEIREQYDELDCTRPENRQGGGEEQPEAPLVTCDREGASKYILGPVQVAGRNVSDATAETRQTTSEWIVTLDFDDKGTREFAQATRDLVGQPPPQNSFAITLDGIVVSAPSVNEEIPTGSAEISGTFTQQDASDLANVLRYGALPLTFDQGEVNTISASVGEDQLQKGVLAGLIGLGLVVVYSLLFYRALGIVSVLSLAVAGLLTYASIVLLGEAISFALILAGVIGVIVAIGITADSFVVFFERLRDEIREGRTIRASVEHAWVRARRTIIVADAVTFLAAVVLYFLSIGRVQNFAFTLGLTTLIDVFVVFLFTKPLVTLLVRREFFGGGHPLSGLNPERVGVRSRRTTSGRRNAPVPTATRTAKEA